MKQRRTEIANGAVSVFRHKGFHLATVRDIGEASGLSQGTLYNYVRSKEDILYLVCDQLVENYQDAVRAAVETERRTDRRLIAALRAVALSMLTHQDDLLLMYQESHALNKEGLRAVLARVSEFIAFFGDLLAEARTAGLITYSDTYLGADIITFLPVIIALRRWHLARHPHPERIVDNLVIFMARGLGITLPEVSADDAR
ncbi:MAG: TetR/AcrR family transcriptional regulator [Stellaceae bacterium]